MADEATTEAVAAGATTEQTAETTQTETQATDWRALIQDTKLRDHASRFTTPDDLVKGNLELRSERDRLRDTAIVPPGKDAKPEEIATFRKRLGIPETPDGYGEAFPELKPEQLTDDVVASREAWAKRFHEIGVPAGQAKELIAAYAAELEAVNAAQVEADKKFAEEGEAKLRQKYGAEYDATRGLASETAQQLLGDNFEAMRGLETKDGRFVLDHPELVDMFATLGRQMREGDLGPMSEGQKETLQEQADGARRKRDEALSKGDREAAGRYDAQERELLAKLYGDEPVIGSNQRVY